MSETAEENQEDYKVINLLYLPLNWYAGLPVVKLNWRMYTCLENN